MFIKAKSFVIRNQNLLGFIAFIVVAASLGIIFPENTGYMSALIRN